MSTGYRGHAQWRDMSDYVVHFTPGYDVIMSILSGGCVKAHNPFGSARNLTDLGDTQCSACFSEIPLDLLDRLVERRSPFGIGFPKSLLKERGGGRVWYLDKDSPLVGAFQGMINEAMKGGIHPGDRIWKLTPFVDRVVPNQYDFDWEREWRVVGGLTFTPDDVAFLFVPDHLHDAARTFLDSGGHGAGPAYPTAVLLDPEWDDEKLQETLSHLT